MNSEEGKDRPAAAAMLAFDTDKDAESAIASLAKLPKENAATETVAPVAQNGAGAPAGAFAAAMQNGNPEVDGGGEDEASTQPAPAALAASHGIAGF